jgi:hypothetical protein
MADNDSIWITAQQVELFNHLVEKAGPDDCWTWKGPTDTDRYGRASVLSKRMSAHRVAFQLANGPVPKQLVVRHTCDNRMCCNPAHLLAGSQQQNVQDRVDRNRSAAGERNGRAKLNEHAVRFIRRCDLSLAELGRIFGMSPRSIMDIRTRKNWANLE